MYSKQKIFKTQAAMLARKKEAKNSIKRTIVVPCYYDPNEDCHDTKKFLRELMYLDELGINERFCFEKNFISLINERNEHLFNDPSKLLFQYFQYVSKKSVEDMKKEKDSIKERLKDFRDKFFIEPMVLLEKHRRELSNANSKLDNKKLIEIISTVNQETKCDTVTFNMSI